jgi:histidyl-tRNA synthetase
MELAPPRGTQDLLSARADAMFSLYDESHRMASLFGYRYIETPTFEHTELFARTSGETSDVVTKEMYTFEDKGGRSLTLRPESTASVVRAYLEHGQELPSPYKGYYIGAQFRHGRPQAGRLREFRQFGVEVIGTPAPAADIEVIVLSERYLGERGLSGTSLRLNSIGDQTCRPAYRERLIAHLEPHESELDEDCKARLRTNPLRVLDCKVDGGKDFVLDAPLISDHLCDACAAHFDEVKAGLSAEGVAFEHDPRLVRGLDYYTRTAFEFVSSALSPAQATVCGGGRYDGLAEVLGGPATAGVGFAMGLDRVLLAMENEGMSLPPSRVVRCFVITVGEQAHAAAASLVRDLRNGGVSAGIAYEDRPLKAQLKMADRADAEFAAIIGDAELDAGTVTLRRLADGTQTSVQATDVVRGLTHQRESGEGTGG